MGRDDSPKVTACVVAHDEERTIARCLEALFAQETNAAFHVLLVDNASNDGTVAVAEEVASRFSSDSRTFSVVRRKMNNLGAGRQSAVEAATTPLVAFTDADCLVPRNWLASLLETYDAHRERGVTAVGTANQPPAVGSFFHQAQRVMFTTGAGHFGSEQARKTTSPVREVSHLPTCSVLYEREALLEIGGFDRSHRLVCEDVDVSYRLRARDGRLLKIDTVEVEHHSRPSYRSWARKIFRYGWGQVQVMRATREHRKLKFVLPILFALSFPLAFLFGSIGEWTTLYVGCVALLSLAICLRSKRLDLFAHVIPLFFVTHFSYGIGLLAGIAGWSGGRGLRG